MFEHITYYIEASVLSQNLQNLLNTLYSMLMMMRGQDKLINIYL